MRLFDCRSKEVVNVCDCRKLGYVSDVEFCPETGLITALIIPGPPRLFSCRGKDHEIVIPYCCVKQIGEEIILVEINPRELPGGRPEKQER
ncbi:MAG: YlmC/YmxH family sporulation protein [Lachnospiraceae bacterium]|nr:YlmC/YmxH family sporulation protein [Lachnospiraceae bacterium]